MEQDKFANYDLVEFIMAGSGISPFIPRKLADYLLPSAYIDGIIGGTTANATSQDTDNEKDLVKEDSVTVSS